MEEKKKRGCNYTPAEKDMLLELIKKYQNIIENKETNANIILKKRKAWDRVCQLYNAVAVSGCRTWQQLRHLYENLKQRSKKNIAKANHLQFYESNKEIQKKASIDKKEINRTGGGAYKSVLSEQDAQILAMAAPQIQPSPNYYDDAAIYFGDTEPEIIESFTIPDSEVISSSSSAIIQTIEHQDTTMANMSIADNSKPCTVTSINIADDQPVKPQEKNKPLRSSSADDQPAAMVIKPQVKNKPLITSSAGKLKPTHITMKQQYFQTKLRNAKLETKYLINKNKMENNKYKIEMQYWKLRLQKLKSKLH